MNIFLNFQEKFFTVWFHFIIKQAIFLQRFKVAHFGVMMGAILIFQECNLLSVSEYLICFNLAIDLGKLDRVFNIKRN
jgi:hypothetical protein